LGVADLAELEQVNPSMVSRIVGKLVAAGLIERNTGPEDGRTALVHATYLGRSVSQQIKDRRSAELRHAIDWLPEGDREVLRASVPALTRLAEVLRVQARSAEEELSPSG
jgi:DNA-binding MarR family transcriptional regulator